MALTFDTHSTSLTNLAECFKQLETLGCNSFQKKNIIIFTFTHIKAYVIKSDLGVKWVKFNPGHKLNNFGSTPIHDEQSW